MLEIIYHSDFAEKHRPDFYYPYFEAFENPRRCAVIWSVIRNRLEFKESDLVCFEQNLSDEIHSNPYNITLKKPIPLTDEDIGRVHTRYLIEKVKRFCEAGNGFLGENVPVTSELYELALLSAGCVYTAIKEVLEGITETSIAICRPPGHHASSDVSAGFCVFNNIAVALAKIAVESGKFPRTAIIDIDAHYGDGIAKIFYETDEVLYCSAHEFPYGQFEEGFFTELGDGKGYGYNICYPVPIGGGDRFMGQFMEYISPYISAYSPDLIVVALGFDGHWADPVGNLNYSAEGFEFFYRKILKWAEHLCGKKVVFVLEGGYNPVSMPFLFLDLVSVLIGRKLSEHPDDTVFPGFTSYYPFNDKIYRIMNKTREVLNTVFGIK